MPLRHPVSEEPVTRFSRNDTMRSDGSFLQNSSLPLIHPYQGAKSSSYGVPLKSPPPPTPPHPRILELTSGANRGGTNKRPSCVGSNFPD